MRRRNRQPKKTLSVLPLEPRVVLSPTVTLASGVVTVEGTEAGDLVTIRTSGRNVVVEYSSEGELFPAGPPTQSFAKSQVKQVVFNGHGGNDVLRGNASPVPVRALGGAGNDALDGSGSVDYLAGEAGSDTLRGFAGGDMLYGGDDNDVLHGGGGMDAVFGGAGNDTLYGGPGADRYLIYGGTDQIADPTTDDAQVKIQDGSNSNVCSAQVQGKKWTSDEIEQIDQTLKRLQLRTRNTKLLKTSSDGDITILRYGATNAFAGCNTGDGRIHLADGAFSTTNPNLVTEVLIHEIGHNFDETDENTFVTEFQALSGWQNTTPAFDKINRFKRATDTAENWWYERAAKFSSNYARTNPREDFAEAFSAKFMGGLSSQKPGKKNIGRKSTVIEKFLKSITT